MRIKNLLMAIAILQFVSLHNKTKTKMCMIDFLSNFSQDNNNNITSIKLEMKTSAFSLFNNLFKV